MFKLFKMYRSLKISKSHVIMQIFCFLTTAASLVECKLLNNFIRVHPQRTCAQRQWGRDESNVNRGRVRWHVDVHIRSTTTNFFRTPTINISVLVHHNSISLSHSMTLVPVCQDKSWLYQSTKETIVVSHAISNSHALTMATKDE